MTAAPSAPSSAVSASQSTSATSQSTIDSATSSMRSSAAPPEHHAPSVRVRRRRVRWRRRGRAAVIRERRTSANDRTAAEVAAVRVRILWRDEIRGLRRVFWEPQGLFNGEWA
ncbi:uncharacterized protein DS421_10g297810 [Arachis hypogaea]|nr:uncharacterized protein DS421_10g297810 [Arachis hypogaea]QHO15773.1 uncharacterized protein DS421_10g297810 [Arachis hypogaea]